MSTKPKRQRGVRVDCTCENVRHEHGTITAYYTDKCSCDDCRAAIAEHNRAYVEAKTGRKVTPKSPKPPHADQFIATFPYYGGYTRAHIRRAGDQAARQLAVEQGIELTGPLTFRLDPTPAGGWLLVVQGPARTTRPRPAITAAAQHFAYQHTDIAPHLAAWADQHAREAAALAGQGAEGVAA